MTNIQINALLNAYKDAIAFIGKRGTLKDARHDLSGVERSGQSGNRVYVDQRTNTKAGFIEYCLEKISVLEQAEPASSDTFAITGEITFIDESPATPEAIRASHFFGGMDESERRLVIDADHDEAIEINRLWVIRNAPTKAERLSAETGFPVKHCDLELEAEGGDYFAVLQRLRTTVEMAHDEAILIDHDFNLANPREIKYGDRHCFTDCGYLCSAKAREDIEKHYQAMQEDAGEGWSVIVWHNMGWHAELFHEATGCSIKDRFVRGGSEIVYLSDVKLNDPSSRHGLSRNNDLLKRYALDDGDGCSVLAETPRKAIEGMIEILNNQASYIVATIQNLKGY